MCISKVLWLTFSYTCGGVKVQYLYPRCSGVQVKLQNIRNTPLQYKYLNLNLSTVLLSTCTRVVTLHHWPSAVESIYLHKYCATLTTLDLYIHNTLFQNALWDCRSATFYYIWQLVKWLFLHDEYTFHFGDFYLKFGSGFTQSFINSPEASCKLGFPV